MLNAITVSVQGQNDQVIIETPIGTVQVMWDADRQALIYYATNRVTVTIDGPSAGASEDGTPPTVTVRPDAEWPINLVVDDSGALDSRDA